MPLFGITDYPTYLAALLVFLMLPGPGTLAVLTATARGGLRGGYASLAGLIAGDAILMAAAMAGVAALLVAHPQAFALLKYAGAAYLAWLGIQLLRSRPEGPAGIVVITNDHYFRQSTLITLLNPKALVFYLAFFPLFIDRAHYRGPVTLAALALSASTMTLIYGSLLILAGHALARRLRASRRLARWLSRAAGIAVIGFGARLAAA